MTPLGLRMTEDMQVRHFSPRTQYAYLQQVSLFARHFGFLTCCHRHQKLALCRRLLDMPPLEPSAQSEPAPDYHDLFEQLTGASLLQCPACRRGCLFVVGRFEPGEPPPPEDSS